MGWAERSEPERSDGSRSGAQPTLPARHDPRLASLLRSDGLADEMRYEIQRVIFEATDATQRLDTDSFEQLAEDLNAIQLRRHAAKEAIETGRSDGDSSCFTGGLQSKKS